MASTNSPAKFVFKFDDSQKKLFESSFPGLTLPGSQDPLEEMSLYKQLSKTFDELKSGGIGENSLMTANLESFHEEVLTDGNVTPKSQKPKLDNKRWASVVKAQKKLPLSTELDVSDNHLCESLETFPKSFESHKGFFVINDKIFHCNICSLNLNSVLSLSNHLKTRKHEDNAIEYFKTILPAHLYHIMEFVSFYGSNLCCNLCQCKIFMSSQNPHETIVSIMSHNSDESHVSKKVNRETCNMADTILQSLSASCHVISENVHFIERKMVPEFKCKLCKKIIVYDDNKDVFLENFTSHMKSVSHTKNQKAFEVLTLFGKANMTGKDNWAVVNGNIMCTHCNRVCETNLQQLISHVNDVEHATNVLCKLGLSSNFNKASENNTLQENLMNEAKSVALNKPKKGEVEKIQSFEPSSVIQPKKPGCRLRELLSTMPSGLKQIDYVIENEKGSVTCLICNRIVPPTSYNLRTHLLGNKHKFNMEQRNEAVCQESNKTLTAKTSENISSGVITKDQSITMSLSAKCKTLQNCSSGDLKTKGSKPNDYSLKTDRGSFMTCLLCHSVLPDPTLANEHLASDEHKKKENLWLQNCPSCSLKNPFTFRVRKALPNSIRMFKCRQMETIPASVLNHLYSLLLKENQLVKKNEKVLIKNVDGKHSYCKLCRSLIPLSLDLDVLENNLISHLKEKRHEGFITGKNINTQSTSPKVARPLFDLPDEFQNLRKDPNVYNFEDFTQLICKDRHNKTEEEENKSFSNKVLEGNSNQELDVLSQAEDSSSGNEVSYSSAKKKGNGNEVFIFGKADNKGDTSLENSKDDKGKLKNFGQNGVLPVADVTPLVKFEEEANEDVLNRRQKQIDYGKNTEGYTRYCSLIPRRKRGTYHPVTPPKHLRCSRRTWDGMIRAWRRQLHSWDPPASTVESDIRPLN